MANEPTPKPDHSEIEKHLLTAGQLQFNIEVLKAALQAANQKINDLQQEALKAPAPLAEAQPESA